MRLAISMVAAIAAALVPSVVQAQPLVDHHQHLFSQSLTGQTSYNTIDAAQLVALLDSAGIKRAVVLSTAYQYSNPNRPAVPNEYEHVKAENDWTSREVARFPNRLVAFCSVNPLKDYALEEIARCAKDANLRYGLKLHFGNSDVDVTNPTHVEQLQRVFRSANEHRMAIVVHMRSSVTKKRPYGAKEATIFLEKVIPAAPDVPVQIAHLSGAGGYEDPQVDEALSVFTTAVRKKDPRMARVLFDVSGVCLGDWKPHAAKIAERIRQLGVSRIVYGSDGAAGGNLRPREAWAVFRELPLTEEEFRAIATNVAPYLE